MTNSWSGGFQGQVVVKNTGSGTLNGWSLGWTFPGGQAIFTCSTQLVPYQRVHFLGTKGRIEIEIPFNAPPDKPTRIFVNDQVQEFPVCDQYTIQGELFSRAILEDTEVPVPLEDALKNMAVIEKILASDAGI